jgi:SAM-dependent methyltransferase
MSQKDYDVVIERGKSEINDRIIDFLKGKIKGKYLDVGANTGWLLREVPNGIGIDSSRSMVDRSNGRVIYGNAENIPFADCTFETVVLSCILEQCQDWKKALNEAKRVGRKVIGINPIPGSRWGIIGGWVKSVIPEEEIGGKIEKIDDERYYFEL